jgi:uncharacterized protein YacL
MKKIRDTKIGKFLMEKAPKVLDVVGNLLPNSGALGIIKNLINSSPDIVEEDKAAISEELVKIYELEVQDRDSARNREVEIAKTSKHDYLFHITGIIGLLAFCFIVYAIVYRSIPEANKDIWIHLIGIIEGIVITIFGYFFGSSKNSK